MTRERRMQMYDKVEKAPLVAYLAVALLAVLVLSFIMGVPFGRIMG